jgi:acyl-CoA dehydrogenase-like protein
VAFTDDLADFEAGARAALEHHRDGWEALEGLDWWEVAIGEDNRAAFGGLFVAEGKTLATTPALGAAIAAPAARAAGGPDGLGWGAALAIRPLGSEYLRILAPASFRRAEALVLELGPAELGVVPVAEVEVEAHTPLDPGIGVVARVARHATEIAIGGEPVRAIRARMASEGRIAAACATVGACDSMLELAREHALSRRQFGRPLAAFQAVSHMIAEAWVARTALARSCHAVLEERPSSDPSPEPSLLLKALAGRSGERVCALTLQVLGAIGVTSEHPHHRYWRRVQTLDALIDTGEEATTKLGRVLRQRRLATRPFGVEKEEEHRYQLA